MRRPTPNTDVPVNGKRPGQHIYSYCLEQHICHRCRARWVEANKLACEKCIGEMAAYSARSSRNKNPLLKDKKRPMSAEVIIVKELRSDTYILQVLTDMGPMLTLHKLESIDLRNAMEGKASLTHFRPNSKAAPALSGRKKVA